MTDERTPAESLIEREEFKAAVTMLDQARSDAVAREDLAALEHVLDLARVPHGQTRGWTRKMSGRVVGDAEQNVRFLGHKAALAAGEERVDPPRPPWRDLPRRPLVIGLTAWFVCLLPWPALLVPRVRRWWVDGRHCGIAGAATDMTPS